MSQGDRAYELIVFGATGFTGGMTAEYLARHAPRNLRWAIAGRSREKLAAVKARLVAIDASAEGVGIVEADVDDAASVLRMAASTRVVLTTVGPFIDYGEPVVRACVEAGTDYVDSTGEPHFARLVQARYHAEAKRRGVRLVSSCGFDSIPADLGVLFTVLRLPAGKPIDIQGYLSVRGTFSGGTERSAIKSLAPPPESLAAAVGDPPTGGPRVVRLGKVAVQRHPELGGWVGPLETIDAPVVLRSARTLERYGPDFRYSHGALHPSLFVLLAAFVFLGTIAFLVRFALAREFLLKLVKEPGKGPTEEQMSRGWFKIRFFARCDGETVTTEVSGGDPGYRETSRMLGESALCLVRDRGELPESAGALTPAEAMGELLLARLQAAGLKFEVL
jgi:saccharopine dehydrogenase (NAD+, L-glutamate forming)